MGKKAVDAPLKITKKNRAKQECMEELQNFLGCMARTHFDIDERCKLERHALMSCASAAARKPKVANTINFHLQRIARLMK